MNRIDKLFRDKTKNILSVYFTAGFPCLDSTTRIIKALVSGGADMIEIGIPFSDPMADGPVLQRSNEAALRNGMNLRLLFNQLTSIRNEVEIPLVLMGYLNPVMQYGVEDFCRKCRDIGIDGVILPDLPPSVFVEEYLSFFSQYDLYNILLISPASARERISYIDSVSRGFLYAVSSSSVTGPKAAFTEDQFAYFKRIGSMNLKNPCLIGFGISNHETFINAGMFARGAIIGSAFVKLVGENGDDAQVIGRFINEIRGLPL